MRFRRETAAKRDTRWYCNNRAVADGCVGLSFRVQCNDGLPAFVHLLTRLTLVVYRSTRGRILLIINSIDKLTKLSVDQTWFTSSRRLAMQTSLHRVLGFSRSAWLVDTHSGAFVDHKVIKVASGKEPKVIGQPQVRSQQLPSASGYTTRVVPANLVFIGQHAQPSNAANLAPPFASSAQPIINVLTCGQ
jgi:hypothetical protein